MNPLRTPLHHRWLVMGLCAVALSGCAVQKPPSTLPPTGWPEPPKSATPMAGASSTPGAAPSTDAGPVAGQGVTVPIPQGYLDRTGTQAASSGGSTRLVAFLQNGAGHGITVLSTASDYSDLAAFLAFYVPALNAGNEQTVLSQRAAQVGGQTGAELTLKSKADGHLSTLLLTLRGRTVILVNGDTPDEPTRQAIQQVAQGLTFA